MSSNTQLKIPPLWPIAGLALWAAAGFFLPGSGTFFWVFSVLWIGGYVLLASCYVWMFLRHRSALHDLDEKLQDQDEHAGRMIQKLEEKDQMFEKLLESLPIPLMVLNYDHNTEETIQRAVEETVLKQGQAGGESAMEDLRGSLEKGELEYINAAAKNLFGHGLFGHSTESTVVLLGIVDHQFLYHLAQLIGRNRSFDTFECEVIPKHGARLTVSVNLTILVHNSRRESVVVALQNITEQRRERDAALQAKVELEEAARLKASFFANMSHELKTPLNAIIGFSDMLAESSEDELQREQLRVISNSGRHLLTIVKDILEMTRVETEKGALQFSLFGVREFVEDLIHPFREVALCRGLEVENLAGDDEATMVFCDQAKLHHILGNLLGNALKFTECGRVEITTCTERMSPGQVQHGMKLAQPLLEEIQRTLEEECDDPSEAIVCRLHFSIRDSGIGIDPSQIDRVFEPFVQADSTDTRKYGGAGLGLAVCRKLVETLGGELQCRNRKNGGCEFHFAVVAVSYQGSEFFKHVGSN